MRAILSIAFAAGFIAMSISRLDLRVAIGLETMASNAGHAYQNSPLNVPRMPGDSADAVYRGLKYRKAVYEFYQRRGGAVCWIGSDGLSMPGDSLLTAIRNIRYFGLLPQDYHLTELEESLGEVTTGNSRTEALLTDALLLIAKDLKYGRSQVMPMTDASVNAVRVVERVAGGDRLIPILESQEPNQREYRLLKAALRSSLDTLTGASKHEWMTGHTYSSIPLHRTLQAIEINLERRRISNNSDTALQVVINIPSFTLEVIEGNTSIITSRVIVGAPKTPTPLLTSVIECVVVYPYWHVPRKIAVGEYLPLIQQDTSYLTLHHFEILDRHGNILNSDSLDWASYNEDYFPILMRQREGPDNALGLLKFVFDNPYAVYLHDTNSKRLFKDSYRAYSHGCVRVENAEELAHYLITRDINGRSQVLDTAMQQQHRLSIELTQPVPVEIRYYTCEVRGGKFYRYHDIYKLDEDLISILYGKGGRNQAN